MVMGEGKYWLLSLTLNLTHHITFSQFSFWLLLTQCKMKNCKKSLKMGRSPEYLTLGIP